MSILGTAGRPPVNLGKLRELLGLGNDGNWIHTAAIRTVFKTVRDYGAESLPVWNEILEAALHSRWNRTRIDCQILFNKYLKGGCADAGLLQKIRNAAENDNGGVNDFFFIDSGVSMLNMGDYENGVNTLSSVMERGKSAVLFHVEEFCGFGTILPRLREEAEKYSGGKNDTFFREVALSSVQNGKTADAVEILASVIHRDGNPPKIRDEIFLELLRKMGHGKEFQGVWEQLKAAIVLRESKAEISHMENLRDLMKPQGKMRGAVHSKSPVSVQPGKIERRVARA